jgi:ABC-type branched-subunit amino acid transport system ATPase component
VAVVLVEQRQSLVRRFADRCLWLSDGKVMEWDGSPEGDRSSLQTHPMIPNCGKGNT